MSDMSWSRHATQRMNQRGLRKTDIDLILRCGTPITRDRIQLRRTDVADAIAEHRREIQRLERLRDRTVVVREDIIVTCY